MTKLILPKHAQRTKPQSKMIKITKVKPAKVNYETVLVTQMQKVTTVHGTNNFSSKRGKRLMLWCAIMVGNVVLTAYFLYIIQQKFNENQIITQVDANCKVSQIPYPAVSICNFNVVSLKESANIVKILKLNNVPEKDMDAFFDSLNHLTTFGKYSRNLRNFTGIMAILKRHYFTIETIMEEVHQKCENLLVYCTFNRKPKPCTEIFTLIKTVEGYCCTFNYVGVDDAAEGSLLPPDTDFEYYDGNDETENSRIIMTSESGSTSGLSVVLNFEPNDYPKWSSIPYYGAKVMISDPKDYPETGVLYRYISLGEWVEIKVEGILIQSSPEIKQISPERRGCRFFDEMLLENTDRYSYETCTTECKMQGYVDNCGCLPFMYPRVKSSRLCELDDLKCLNNVTVHMSLIDMNCNTICFMECRDKKYAITSDLVPFVMDEFPLNITHHSKTKDLAALQVYYGKSNCNCYKKSLLIDVNYFIATYGGVFSLSFGASIMTIFEFSFILSTMSAKSIWRVITNVRRRYKW